MDVHGCMGGDMHVCMGAETACVLLSRRARPGAKIEKMANAMMLCGVLS